MGMFGGLGQRFGNAFGGDNIAMAQALAAGDYGAVSQMRARAQAQQQQQAALQLRQDEAEREAGQRESFGNNLTKASDLGGFGVSPGEAERIMTNPEAFGTNFNQRYGTWDAAPGEMRQFSNGGAPNTVLQAPTADAQRGAYLDTQDPTGRLRLTHARGLAFPPTTIAEGGGVVGLRGNNQLGYLVEPDSVEPAPAPATGPSRLPASAPRREGNQPSRFAAGALMVGDGYGARRPGGGTHGGLDFHGPEGTPLQIGRDFEVLPGSHRQQRVRNGRDGGNIARIRVGDTEWDTMHLPNLPRAGNYRAGDPVIRAGTSGIRSGRAEVHLQPANDAARAIYAQGRQATAAFLSGGAQTAQSPPPPPPPRVSGGAAGRMGAGASLIAGAPRQPVRVSSVAAARSLPRGTVFITPDGRRKVR